MTLKEWFYPHAESVSRILRPEYFDHKWKGRIPILVEDAWIYQQKKIDKLEKELREKGLEDLTKQSEDLDLYTNELSKL